MRKLSRFFVLVSIAGLFTAYAPVTQAQMQQGYDSTAIYNNSATASFATHDKSYGSKVGNKALNAFANLTTAPLEIPKNIINTTNKSNVFYGIFGGLAKGMVNIAGRMGVGIADLITIPLPTKPIAHPMYIWDDFDIDTSYGPVFRLDRSQEEKPPVVEAPSPVAPAPAVVAPKPQPIDNSKLYNQETNHQLDEMFKKEMKK
jgi:putative exosortase-associated protein (TIGR04073 family)